jgi:hypothetical protein
MVIDVYLLQNEEDAFAALAVMVDQLPQNYFSVRAGGWGFSYIYIPIKIRFYSHSVCPRDP